MTPVTPSIPLPAEIDALSIEYLKLKEKVFEAMLAQRTAQKNLDDKKDELIALVSDAGSVHAEKSKLLHGITHEIMGTFGVSTVIDASAVERFRIALKEAKQTRALKKIFQETVRWTLAPTAAVIIKGEKLSDPLLALYSQCEVTKEKTPILTVRPKETP